MDQSLFLHESVDRGFTQPDQPRMGTEGCSTHLSASPAWPLHSQEIVCCARRCLLRCPRSRLSPPTPKSAGLEPRLIVAERICDSIETAWDSNSYIVSMFRAKKRAAEAALMN